MNKKLALTSLLLASLTSTGLAQAESIGSNPQYTEPTQEKKQYTEAKQSAAFASSAIVGAVAGGPVGFILGALGGAYISETIKDADEAVVMNGQLQTARTEIDRLQQQLLDSRDESRDLEALALESLTLPVLFRTGSDILSDRGREHVMTLAEFMKRYPRYRVLLNGHTDPRGTDEYNNVLSHARALSVKESLAIAGIDPARIDVQGLGSSESTAPRGDALGYARERRVEIDLILEGSDNMVMN